MSNQPSSRRNNSDVNPPDLQLAQTNPTSPKIQHGSPQSSHRTLENSPYHNLSASVLQHASPRSQKFTKAVRFPPINNKGSPRSRDSSPKGTEGSDYFLTGSYSYRTDFGLKNKGPSFGLPFSAYEKTYIPGSKGAPLSMIKGLPGPGAYSIPEKPIDTPKITMKPRLRMFNEGLGVGIPHCNQYSPKTSLTLSARYAKQSQGFGDKYDFTKPKNDNPGPGAYSPSSFKGKFRTNFVTEKVGNL